MWSREMPREERRRSSRTPTSIASSNSSLTNNTNAAKSSSSSPQSNATKLTLDTNSIGKKKQHAARKTNEIQFQQQHFADRNGIRVEVIMDERTPLTSDVYKSNNDRESTSTQAIIRDPPATLRRLNIPKNANEMKERERRKYTWRDFCPGIVSIVVAFFLFSAANAMLKYGTTKKWYERFRGHARYTGPAACFRDSQLSEHCLPHFAIVGASASTQRLREVMKRHPMVDEEAKAVHFWNTPYGTRSGATQCEPKIGMLKAYVDALMPKMYKNGEQEQEREHERIETGENFDEEKHRGYVYGDWSDTSFSCSCCANAMQKALPRLRPIVVLSDPIERAIERYAMENVDEHSAITTDNNPANLGGIGACAATKKSEIEAFKTMKSDLDKCGGFENKNFRNAKELSACLDAHTVLGPSRYDHYLSIWRTAFPNTLVLFDQDFTKDRLESTARRVENYLGLSEHKAYDFSQIWQNIESMEKKSAKRLSNYDDALMSAIQSELLEDIGASSIENLMKMAYYHDLPNIPNEWVEKYVSKKSEQEEQKQQQQQQQQQQQRRMLKEWSPKTNRGKLYQFSGLDIDPKILVEADGFIPIANKNTLRIANSFRANGQWLNILSLTDAQKRTTFSELWREDCTHAQQWDASNGCCGEDCCFDAAEA